MRAGPSARREAPWSSEALPDREDDLRLGCPLLGGGLITPSRAVVADPEVAVVAEDRVVDDTLRLEDAPLLDRGRRGGPGGLGRGGGAGAVVVVAPAAVVVVAPGAVVGGVVTGVLSGGSDWRTGRNRSSAV